MQSEQILVLTSDRFMAGDLVGCREHFDINTCSFPPDSVGVIRSVARTEHGTTYRVSFPDKEDIYYPHQLVKLVN